MLGTFSRPPPPHTHATSSQMKGPPRKPFRESVKLSLVSERLQGPEKPKGEWETTEEGREGRLWRWPGLPEFSGSGGQIYPIG